MGKQSSYTAIDIFASSKKLVLSCYALTQELPADEKSNLGHYIRNAALTAHFAISQGVFLKKSKAKKKLLQQAKNSYVVIDAAVDVLVELNLVKEEQTSEVIELASLLYQHTGSLPKQN